MSDETVRVVIRCRPFNSREKTAVYGKCVQIHKDLRQIEVLKTAGDPTADKAFTFDAVYDSDSTQNEVYMDVGYPMVNSILEGYNGTIFAYGQTGCGKTFTMEGLPSPPEMRGIIPSCFSHIFATIANDRSRRFLVFASYIEIYNEEVRDLIGDDPKQRLEVKESPEKGVFVQGLTKTVVTTVEEMDALQKKGNRNRSVGFTKMNADSSRSHSIFTITIETTETHPVTGEDHIRAGKLNLVDLAGSERQAKTAAEGLRLKEATKINLSLSALGNVISALTSSNKVKHVPYRDSKLTRLLQDSLGGNTRTVMLAAISPSEDAYDETLTTLRYANRAKNIKNKPVINEDPKDAMLRQYQEEINRLRVMLEQQASGSAAQIVKSPEESNEKVSEIYKLEAGEILQLKQEIMAQHEEKSRLLEEERGRTLELQRRLQEEWDLVQADRNNLAAHREATPNEAEALDTAQQELEMAMDQNAVRSAALDSELQDMRYTIEAEHTMTLDEFRAILDAKEAQVQETQQRQIDLEQEKIASDAEKARLQQMLSLLESQVIAGGNQSMDQKLEHERQMMEAQERLLQEQRHRDELLIQHKKAEDDRLMLKEHFGTLQEEVQATRQKLQTLQAKYNNSLTEIKDLQAEYEYEREETLESLRQANRDLDLYKLILSQLTTSRTVEKVVQVAVWDDDNECWDLSRETLRLLRDSTLPDSPKSRPSAELPDDRQEATEPKQRSPRRPPSINLTTETLATDDKFADLRRLVNDPYSSFKRPAAKPSPSAPTPSPRPVSVAAISKWDRSKSVLNEIRPLDNKNEATQPNDIIEDIIRKLPTDKREKFLVQKKPVAAPAATNSTPALMLPDTPIKPRFDPSSKPSAIQTATQKQDDGIMAILNRPLETKAKFQVSSNNASAAEKDDEEDVVLKLPVPPTTERIRPSVRKADRAKALPESLLSHTIDRQPFAPKSPS